MSMGARSVLQLNTTLKYFKNTLSCFEPQDAEFAPTPEMFTVAGHVAHTAHTVEWFIEGAFGKGWDMDFETANAEANKMTSLEETTAWLERAFAKAVEVIGSASDEELSAPIPDKSLMGDAPRVAIVNGILDHTAHHRGSLAVYARLVGKIPMMPYS